MKRDPGDRVEHYCEFCGVKIEDMNTATLLNNAYYFCSQEHKCLWLLLLEDDDDDSGYNDIGSAL